MAAEPLDWQHCVMATPHLLSTNNTCTGSGPRWKGLYETGRCIIVLFSPHIKFWRTPSTRKQSSFFHPCYFISLIPILLLARSTSPKACAHHTRKLRCINHSKEPFSRKAGCSVRQANCHGVTMWLGDIHPKALSMLACCTASHHVRTLSTDSVWCGTVSTWPLSLPCWAL